MNSKQLLVLILGLCPLVVMAQDKTPICRDSIPETASFDRYTWSGITAGHGGTVTDTETGLMWARCPWGLGGLVCDVGDVETLSYSAAETAVTTANNDTYLGHTGWRLPTVQELSSLVERSCRAPAIQPEAICIQNPGCTATGPLFPNVGVPASETGFSPLYWSSTDYVNQAHNVWVVNFDMGNTDRQAKGATARLRLVRVP